MSLIMLLVKDLDTLIMYGTFSELFFIAVALSSIFYFRYSMPNAPRPIKVCFLVLLSLTILDL